MATFTQRMGLWKTMIECNACSGEQVRFIGDRQVVSGRAYCTAVSMLKLELTQTPEKLCLCYAQNPKKHLENHRDTKAIGKNFVNQSDEIISVNEKFTKIIEVDD